MTKGLFLQAFVKFISGIFLVGLLIFLPAGTFSFVNGWLFMGLLFVPMLILGIVLLFKNPELLKKRLDTKESRKKQSRLVKLSGLIFTVSFIVAGLGFRSGWYILPKGITILASAVFLAAYLLYAETLRENTYLSRTIEVQENQRVIDTGMYGIVRHPMYSATLFMFLSIPLILGSVYSFLIFLVYPFIIIKRLKDEEVLLEKELEGYCEYIKKVKYRLIPFIW